MALSGTDRGTGNHNTSATIFTGSPASNFSSGTMAVLCVAADNNSTGGSTNNFTGVTDSLGNTWTIRQAPIFDNGAAAAGVQGIIATTSMNGGTLTTSTVITVGFGTATVAKTWTLMEISGTTVSPSYRTGGVSAGATTTTPSMNTGTITNGNMVVCALFVEAGTTQTATQDGDTTNGTWSTQQYNEIGTTTSGSVIQSQRKVVTATATQTFNPTLSISSDLIMAWIEIAEVTASLKDIIGSGIIPWAR